MSTLAISAANLNTLENNLITLSNNINNVSSDIININGQISSFSSEVNDIKSSVKSLEQEIRDFMFEIRGTTIVSNAQNDILLKENELNKKYGSYDIVRKKTNGLFESIDANVVNNASLLRESEKLIMNTPTYYLSYALASICAWFNDDKITAYKALNGALKLNESKTSLLLALVHLRLNRKATALKWVKKYLAIQDPLKLDSEVIYIFDALTNDTYNNDILNEILLSIKKWNITVKNNQEIVDAQKARWDKFFTSDQVEVKEGEYPFIVKFTNNFEKIRTALVNSYSYDNISKNFDELINNVKNSKNKSIDNLLNDLVNNYEENEAKLKKDILKDKLIINMSGDTKEALESFNMKEVSLNYQNDFYTTMTNIVFDRNDVSKNTKKMAISYLKDIIRESFEKSCPTDNFIGTTNIMIDDWNGSTTNGENENELKESLTTYVKSTYEKDFNNNTYFDIKVIISAVAAVIGIVLALKYFALGVIITIISLIICFIMIYNITKTRDYIAKECTKSIENSHILLENTLAEIVDASFIIKRSQKNKDAIIHYLNNFNESDYTTSNNKVI